MRTFSKIQICIKRSQAKLDYVWGRGRFIKFSDKPCLVETKESILWTAPFWPQIFRSFGRHNYLRHHQGLCLLKFVGSRRVKREQKNLQRLLNLPLRIGTNEHLMQTEAQLREYFFWYAPLFRYCIAYARNIVSKWSVARICTKSHTAKRAGQPPRAGSPHGQAVRRARRRQCRRRKPQEVNYLHCDHINIPGRWPIRAATCCGSVSIPAGIVWKRKPKVTDTVYQPFRLQSQYCDVRWVRYDFFRYYEPDAGRFVN